MSLLSNSPSPLSFVLRGMGRVLRRDRQSVDQAAEASRHGDNSEAFDDLKARLVELSERNQALEAKVDTLAETVAKLLELGHAAATNGGLSLRHLTTQARRGEPIRVGFLVHNFEAWGLFARYMRRRAMIRGQAHRVFRPAAVSGR